jgi:hypothetical protein
VQARAPTTPIALADWVPTLVPDVRRRACHPGPFGEHDARRYHLSTGRCRDT